MSKKKGVLRPDFVEEERVKALYIADAWKRERDHVLKDRRILLEAMQEIHRCSEGAIKRAAFLSLSAIGYTPKEEPCPPRP